MGGDGLAVPSGRALSLAGSFPARLAQGVETVEGVVTVTNTSGLRFHGLSAIAPDVYLTQGGRTIAAPVPRDAVGVLLDLEPAESRELAARGSVRGLAPGRYEIRAVLRVFGQGECSPEGGPWPLEILPREDLR
jgi:hypothetical protein